MALPRPASPALRGGRRTLTQEEPAMTFVRSLGLTVVILLGAVSARADGLVLAENGQSAFQIVVAGDASPSTKHAAQELHSFLQQISGAKLPVVSDNQPAGPHEIVLGESARLKSLNVAIDFKALGNEGYVIRTAGPHLVIAGGAMRGNLYGVYGLLEDHLGCRWFAPGVSRVPQVKKLALPAIDERKVPALEYREPFTTECFDGDWCARNRMNSSTARLEAKHGGKVKFGSGFFVHTFAGLVPPQKHFKDHPEYFSLVKGKRQDGYAQLCCTNEDVIRLCTEGTLAAMKAQPDAFVFSVSQNDTDLHCECDKCQALAKQEDSQIAPVLHLVNRVAEAAEKPFPRQAIETLAYQWTRRPPKAMRPRPNVIIRLCSIECCFSHPLGTCDSPANRAFVADLQGWAKVSNRLWIWDYVTDFSHYLLPFPNQRVRNDNIRLFLQNNVKGIFEQDTYNTPQGELSALGGYMTAKFLWNPDYDENVAMNEFLEAYYGKAAAAIRKYLDLLHDKAERENLHVVIWAPPSSPHLAGDLLPKADALWEDAEKAVSADAEVLRRVKVARMSVDYAIAERARAEAGKGQGGDQALVALAKRRFPSYTETLAASGLTHLSEGGTLNAADYRAKLGKALGIPAKE
jgi:hypothetical protein